MEAQGLALKQEPYQMRVPRSQRGGEIVEPLVREQWFVRMEPLAKPALEVSLGPAAAAAAVAAEEARLDI
jgi:valyl-tRNA synthetase